MRPDLLTRTLFLALLAISVSSCGWQLRGQNPAANNLTELSGIYISADSGNSVAQALRSQLGFRNVALLEQPAANGLALLMEPPQTEQRVQTLSGDLRARQIRLQMDVSFSLYNFQADLLASETMQAVRNFAQNPLEPASIDRQEELFEAEMAEQLAANIIRLMSQHALSALEN